MTIKDKNLYFVGGVVRDELIGQPSFDIDFCYEGDAIKFSKDFNVIKTNPAFGTVRIINDEKEIDIASTRTEKYPKKGHLPVVEKIGCALEEDLKRRDFTINALAKNTITGEISDFFGGLEDIKNKKLRVLHNDSFIDDPTRIIRALKFAIRFGFELDEHSKALQDSYLENINYDMSYHRLKKELKETFNLNIEQAYESFINNKIYKLLGEGQSVPTISLSIQSLVDTYKPKHIWLVYMGLFDLSNFELTAEEAEIINSYNSIKELTAHVDCEIYNLFKSIPIESILLYALTINSDIALKYLNHLSKIRISLSGEDLKKLGVQEGKIYKEIFDSVLTYKLENPSITKDDEIEFIRRKYL